MRLTHFDSGLEPGCTQCSSVSDQYWLQQGTKPNPLTLGDKTD